MVAGLLLLLFYLGLLLLGRSSLRLPLRNLHFGDVCWVLLRQLPYDFHDHGIIPFEDKLFDLRIELHPEQREAAPALTTDVTI